MPPRSCFALLAPVLAVAALLAIVGPAQTAAAMYAPSASPPRPAAPSPAPATFGIQPARQGQPDIRPFLSYSASPGAELDDQVVVLNYSDAPLRLTIVPADGVATQDGSFAIAPTAQRPVEVGRWVHLRGGRPTVVVPARDARRKPGSTVVPFRLTLPGNISPGDHFGGIAAVLSSQGSGDQAVRLEQRIATRLYVRVSGAERPRLSIRGLTVDFDNSLPSLGIGTATVRYRVVNTGNIKLGAHQRVVVGGWIGPDRTARPTDVPLLFPGSSVLVTAVVKDVWPIIPDSTRVQLLPVHLQGDPAPGVGRVEASTFFWAVPWGPVLLLLILVLLRPLRRRFRGPSTSPRHLRPGPPPGVVQDRTVSPETDDALARRATFSGLVLAALLFGTGWGTAWADPTVPYDDASSTGALTFCDSNGHEIREGELAAAPFAQLVLGSTSAPQGYRPGDGGTATLYAHQPRQGTEPGEWSGLPLTGAARFTSASHPSTQVLPADTTLRDAAEAYPPQWQGLLQLRLVLSAPGRQALGTRYDSADIEVEGARWRLVRGGGGSCPKTATARAVAFQLGTVDATGHVPGQVTGPSKAGFSSPTPEAHSATRTGAGVGSSDHQRPLFGGSNRSGALLGGALVLLLVGAGLGLLRRRPRP